MRSLTESAAAVCAALVAAKFDASQGRNKHAGMVVVKHVVASQRGKVDYIAQQAADPHYCDLRHNQTYFTLVLHEGREQYLEQKKLEKYGESAYIGGVLIKANEINVPLRQSDPYSTEAA